MSLEEGAALLEVAGQAHWQLGDLERADYLVTSPSVPLESYRDSFGNWCTRMVAPAGEALTCGECHGDATRLDWEALGYNGDPMEWGSRRAAGLED